MARRKQPTIPDQVLDQLLAGADAKTAFDKDGLLDELKKALAERALNAEMDHHLDAGEGDGNSRNGYGRKTVLTETGKIEIEVPRDRRSTFDPQLPFTVLHCCRSRFYSMTVVACTRTDCGNLMPSALAVFMLMTNSNWVGCSTGRSEGFAPFRILST